VVLGETVVTPEQHPPAEIHGALTTGLLRSRFWKAVPSRQKQDHRRNSPSLTKGQSDPDLH
jgi:hypothetical protein